MTHQGSVDIKKNLLDQCFPKPQSIPITVRDAFIGVSDDGTGGRVGEHTKIYQAMRNVRQGESQPDHFSHQRLHLDRPSPTIRKGMNGICHYHLWHPTEHRVITLAECKRLASFGDDFQFRGGVNTAWERIGNAVPPLFMRSIAWQIRATLFGGPSLVPYPKTMNYLEILDQAWTQHLAPRGANVPTVISTFAGCGGSSLGYSMAGYCELLAVEWDQNAVDTFRLNFPDVPVWHGDIAKLSVDECLARAGVQPGELDVLDGSPPCQGFSTAGKREMADPRNQLFREYVRLLRGLQPRVFVMENVSGMVKGKMKLIFADILRELKASGYLVSARLMNAMYFNVPQSRQRMIFIGVREDVGVVPSHPRGHIKPPTIRDALPWIVKIEHDSMGLEGIRTFDPAAESFCTIRQPGGGSQTRYIVEAEADMSRYKVGDKWDALKPGESVWYGGRLWKPSIDAPCPSITKTGMDAHAAGVCHPTEKRKFYSWELQRLASFPDPFELIGTYNEKWARIGNSVPPLFMRAIARHIREHILDG